MLQSVLKMIGCPCTKAHLPSYRRVTFRHVKEWLLCGGFTAQNNVCASGLARGKTLVSTAGVCCLNVPVARVPRGRRVCLRNRTRTVQWCAQRQTLPIETEGVDRVGRKSQMSSTWCLGEAKQELVSQIWRECCPRYESVTKLKDVRSQESHGNCDMPQGCWLFLSFFKNAKSASDISFACGSGSLKISHPLSNM